MITRRRVAVATVGALVALVGVGMVALLLGAAPIRFGDVARALTGRAIPETTASIVLSLRLPRRRAPYTSMKPKSPCSSLRTAMSAGAPTERCPSCS